jgi:oxygen-independent coproporphyrinogen-3 oxidase
MSDEARPPVRRRADAAAGIYVHVPFCAKICPYCDFAVTARRPIDHAGYVDALLDEFAATRERLRGRRVHTIYVGGGTPSLLAPDELTRLLDALRARAPLVDAPEITLEANPDDITRGRLEAWSAAGVGRLSVGIQSFDDDQLAALGRNHDARRAREAVALLEEHWPGLTSIDLIFGGPGADLDTWRSDLSVVASLDHLDHLSAYHLTVEPHTPFARRAARGELELVDDERATDMLEELRDLLARRGFEQYEVSSYARPGARSRHNSLYWTGGEYLGLGVGAHGLHLGDHHIERRTNTRHLSHYLADPTTPSDIEEIDAHTHLFERAFTGIRTRLGLDLDELTHQFADAVAPQTLEALAHELDRATHANLLERGPDRRYRPTPRGFLVADGLGARLWPPIAATIAP